MVRTSRIAVFFAALLSALPAKASPAYPEALAAQLGLSCPPVCTLCHDTMAGGAATVNTRFGIEVRARRRLVSGNTELLFQVMTQLEADGTDSDGDGTGDVAELKAGTNPNDTGSTPLGCYTPPPEEEEGCAVGQRPGHNGLPLFAALLMAAILLRRRVRVSSV
jgi:hypothetical protein